MLVLRFTIGQTTQEIRTPRSDVVVGSDPTADVTLPTGGLAPRALRLVQDDTEVHLEELGTGRRLTLRVGDVVEVAGVEVALIGLLPADPAANAMFGGYDDHAEDHAEGQAPASNTFELSDPTPAPTIAGMPSPPASFGSTSATQESSPPADSTPADRSRGRGRRRTAAGAAATAGAVAGAAEAATQGQQRPLTPQERAAQLKRLKFPDPNFGAGLVAQLKRSPFFALSAGFHLLIFFIIFLFDTTTVEPPIREGPGAMVASLSADEEELAADVPLDEEGLPLDEMTLPDIPELEFDETPPTAKPPTAPSPFRDEEENDEPEPADIGIMPGLRVTQVRPRKHKPKMPKMDLKQKFTKGAAGSTNQRSADVVRAALGAGRRGNGAKLDDLKKDDILVVSGSFDHIHKVLDALRLKYVRKAPWSLTSPKPLDFKKYKIVFWNCGESLGRRRMASIGKRLKAFVRDGGYLFTTDWGVANVLPYAFPGFIRTNGNKAHLPEMVLSIEAARSARNHPLLEGVFHKDVQGKWWLEQASFDMAVGRKDRVTVLIECPMLKSTFNRSPAVAVTFHDGRGRVLHTMGHYFQEAGNLAGTMSAHRLALNFVLMRLEQDRKAKDR